ncbi:MAG: hypothetical protein NZ570_03865 [Candidatus Caldarchaeum sp.]|nr:hypothetical protein [Candidatus Caldarchaeum sp.]MCS7137785.1 hypothetical protein [Candidatus Caldarchaeum sp.]MDW7978353.1 hypothetical protein [Candidatus Caldarchaeum sp.]MDW8359834.1 hypothetical protein [Candidatus Caldarchaeum sp.]
MKSKIIVAAVAVVVLAGLGGYLTIISLSPQPQPATQPRTPTTATPTPTTTPTATIVTTPTSRGLVVLTLYLNDYGYNASVGGPTIRAYVGDVIRLRLVGNGSGPIVHDFVLDEKSPSPYSVKSERLRRGQEQVIEFTAQFAGVYKYYCSVAPFAGPSHRDRGQEGTIEILQR